jgi:hypothetical protein
MKNAPENLKNVGTWYLGPALRILFLFLCHVFLKQNLECKGEKGAGNLDLVFLFRKASILS